jgi:hypothetical protein
VQDGRDQVVEPNGTTKRVELSNDQWAVLRTKTTVGDVRFQREQAHARGFDDSVLDGLSIIERMIVEWSFGAVTREAIDALTEEDAVNLMTAARDDGRPNPSTPSLSGGRRKKASDRSSG